MEQFWLLNLFFVTLVLSGLAYFGVAWLFWDAHRTQANRVYSLRAAGFAIMAVGSIAGVFSLENTIAKVLLISLYLVGSIIIAYGVHAEKLNALPAVKKEHKVHALIPIIIYVPVATVIALAATSIMLYRRIRLGLVKEYRLWFISWVLLTLSQFIALTVVFTGSTNVTLAELARPFGTAWTIAVILQLISSAILGCWLWMYLRFRIAPQLFLSFVTLSVLISTISAVIYSTLLFSIVESDFNKQLGTNVETSLLNIQQMQEAALTSANFLSKSESIRRDITTNNLAGLFKTINDYINRASDIDYIVVTDNAGTILVKTNEFSLVGDKSLSGDEMVIDAVNNKASHVSLVTRPSLLANNIEIVATAPILADDNSVKGVIQTGFVLDNAYADRLKQQTNLEVTIFAADKRSATTLLGADGKSRAENTVETNQDIIRSAINERQVYTGKTIVLTTPYYTAYAPLVDIDNKAIGMVSVGRAQVLLISAIESAVLNTFLVSILISIISIFPAKALSDYIRRNYRA